jgi:hypothetical protein
MKRRLEDAVITVLVNIYKGFMNAVSWAMR